MICKRVFAKSIQIAKIILFITIFMKYGFLSFLYTGGYMRVAILDDESIFIDKLYKLLFNKFNYELSTYTDPQKLLDDYQKGIRYDIIFSDVLMEPYNGIEVGKKIREYDKSCFIIFLTTDLYSAPKGYEVNAFRYLLKPITREALSTTLDDINKEIHKDDSLKLLLDTTVGSLVVNTNNILYLEVNDKETIVYTDEDLFYVRKAITEFEQELSSRNFFRIHRKFLVNMAKIAQFDGLHITLENGKTISISRRKYKEFCQAFDKFVSGS